MTDLRFDGRVAIVTDAGPAEAVAREIRGQGGEAVADTHSVATRDGGEAFVHTALKTYGQLDILVNNAGIVRDVPLGDMAAGHLDPMIDVHLKGAFHVTVPAWRVMREQGYGRVVNTTSSAGILGSEHKSHYGAAKTGATTTLNCPSRTYGTTSPRSAKKPDTPHLDTRVTRSPNFSRRSRRGADRDLCVRAVTGPAKPAPLVS